MGTARPKIVIAAFIVAFILAALLFVSIPFAPNPPGVGLSCAVLLAAGIGIWRRRAWSAYGFALVMTCQFLIVGINLGRSGGFITFTPQMAVSVSLALILIVLFLFTGRSLAETGAPRGRPLPWLVLAILCSVPFLFVQAFVIPTGAMEDTILIGDHIFVLRFPLVLPQRGDLTVFRYPVDRRQIFVKRVVGVAGDRIKIIGKKVFRNGTQLDEPYASHKSDYVDSYRDNFPSEPNSSVHPGATEMLENSVREGEVVVPNGRYFVLGDNRDNSLDSRYWGFIEPMDVLGKPLMIYFSKETTTDEAMRTAQPSFVVPRVRWNRIFKRF